MTQSGYHMKKKFGKEKENPNKSITKPKAFVNGSLKNSSVKLKDVKEELDKMNTDKSGQT